MASTRRNGFHKRNAQLGGPNKTGKVERGGEGGVRAIKISKINKRGHFFGTGEHKGSFKIYDVTTWLTNNYNTYITQYLTKQRQPEVEIWSGNTT